MTRRLPRSIIVSVSSSGVELWGKRSAGAPIITLGWAAIDHVEPSHELVSGGRTSIDARTVRVFAKGEDGTYELPLPIYGPRSLRYANVARANEVMGWFAQYTRVVGTDI